MCYYYYNYYYYYYYYFIILQHFRVGFLQVFFLIIMHKCNEVDR